MRAVHRERAHRIAAVLNDVAGAATDADRLDDVEDHVLGGDAWRELAVDLDRHGALGGLRERLCREHVLDLGGTDAESEGPEGSVGGGVAIAADERHPRLGEALLGADDVHDPLAGVVDVEEGHLELGAVSPATSPPAARRGGRPRELAPEGGHVVVDRGKRTVRAA